MFLCHFFQHSCSPQLISLSLTAGRSALRHLTRLLIANPHISHISPLLTLPRSALLFRLVRFSGSWHPLKNYSRTHKVPILHGCHEIRLPSRDRLKFLPSQVPSGWRARRLRPQFRSHDGMSPQHPLSFVIRCLYETQARFLSQIRKTVSWIT